MVLIDTSVWINFFNDQNSKPAQKVAQLIENNEAYICPIILQEILQGISKDSDFNSVNEGLSAIEILDFDMTDASVGAAEIYRKGRKNGFTIRKSNDCLIAWYAMKAKIPIFSLDRDFALISQFSGLQVYN